MVQPEDASGRRVRLDAGDRRESILVGARRLFAERPYSEVSTTDLAEAAGTTRTNLHYYFGTKRALYLEVVREFGRLPELPADQAGRTTGERELHRLIGRWLGVLAEHPQTILTLVETWSPGADPEVAEVFREGAQAWQARLLAVLEIPDTGHTRAALRAFQGMAGVALEEWLRFGRLTGPEVQQLLTSTLMAMAPVLRGGPGGTGAAGRRG
ncbi:MAG: putative TetR family transcriptional regulator [Klenkia sp.]|nr:putative TetR family transcriptional regulator [Klenkia sp.]